MPVKQTAFKPGRISALSDGVFGIAMTLLVLNLRLPDVGPLTEAGALATGLARQLPRFLSWLLSFAILCRLWIVHHALLADGDTRTTRFTIWNFVFLGAIAFIPFPTSLLAEHPDQLVSVIVFSATFVVAGIALGGMERSLEKSGVSDMSAGRFSRSTLLLVGTAALSCALAVVKPQLGAAVWFSYPITGGLVKRRDA